MKDLKDQILQMITEFPTTSFAGLSRIPGFSGDRGLFVGDDANNVCMWPLLSQEACDAIRELLVSESIHGQTTSVFTYTIDGCVPRMPLAMKSGKHKKPHWLPMTFKPGPAPVTARHKKRKETVG